MSFVEFCFVSFILGGVVVVTINTQRFAKMVNQCEERGLENEPKSARSFMGQKWKSDIEDWEMIDNTKIDFILQESKLYLQHLLGDFEKLDSKAFIILGVLFTVISGLTGFLVSKYSFLSSSQNWKLLVPILVILSICFVSCFFLIRCILPKSVYSLGNETKNLLNKTVCKSETRLIKIGEALDYQSRIDACKKHNKTKSKNIMIGLIIAVLAPLMGGLCALLL